MKKSIFTAILLGLMISNAWAIELIVVKEGTRVCVTESSLSALQTALKENNKHTLDSLTGGSACMMTPVDMEAEVLEVSKNGLSKIRTTRKRKNIVLWTYVS